MVRNDKLKLAYEIADILYNEIERKDRRPALMVF